MKIFYNFDNMYDKQKTTSNNKKIDEGKSNDKEKNMILNNSLKSIDEETSNKNYDLNKDIALFDYSAKASNRYISMQKCANIDCFNGISNPELPDNCLDYTNCLQYFNTMPLMNCIDNVPTATSLILDK